MSLVYDPLQYEMPLIGAALVKPELAASLVEHLRPEHFQVPDHQTLWAAIGRLCATPERLNVVDVAEAANLALADVASMARDAYSTDAEVVGSWRDVILRKAKLRRLSGQFRQLAGAAEAPGADLEAIQREAAASVLALEQEGVGPKRRSRREILHARVNAFGDRYEGVADPVGLRTGVGALDTLIYGLRPAELVLLAARPAMGKSAMAMQVARLTALQAPRPVVFFSMEMDLDEMWDRWLVQESRVHAGSFQRAKGMDAHNIERIGVAAQRLESARLEANDDIFDVEGIVARAEALSRQHGGLALVVVDYLQLIGTRGPRPANRAQEVGDYSRALKLLAMRLRCPVLALSQLNRGVEERTDKRPLMADLRESGALEQDANKILMLYRDEVYHEQSQDAGIAELIVRKHRGGPIGTVRCLADMPRFTFSDVTTDQLRQQAETAGVDAFA